MKTYKTIRYTCVVLSLLCYFFCFAGRGLQADLSHDDLMNLYKSWYPPVTQHLAEIIAFFTPSVSFRPMGSLFYRVLFEAYGMQALPYRMACYGLLLLNLWLSYCVVRLLANSREVGIFVLSAAPPWGMDLRLDLGWTVYLLLKFEGAGSYSAGCDIDLRVTAAPAIGMEALAAAMTRDL